MTNITDIYMNFYEEFGSNTTPYSRDIFGNFNREKAKEKN